MDLERSFEVAHTAGAEGIEILVTQSEDTQSPNEIERLANRFDLPIVAIHAPQLLLTRRVYGTNQMIKIARTVAMCEALDVKTVVLHPPFRWQLRYLLWSINSLNDAFGGDMVSMENMYPVHVGKRRLSFQSFGRVSSLERFTNVTIDTSHLAVAEEDPIQAYRQLVDRVVHIHLSDNRGKGRDSHAPLGEGVLDIAGFTAGLDGKALRSIALEINPGPGGEDPKALEDTLGRCLELVKNHLPTRTD